MDIIEFGLYLSKLRKEKGITQKELASKLCVTVSAISKWERGKCMPEITKIKELSEIFSISVNDLLNCNSFQNKESEEKRMPLFSKINFQQVIPLLACLLIIAFVVFFIHFEKGRKETIEDSKIITSYDSIEKARIQKEAELSQIVETSVKEMIRTQIEDVSIAFSYSDSCISTALISLVNCKDFINETQKENIKEMVSDLIKLDTKDIDIVLIDL